ncbi:MAG: hypothetical protein EBZ48_15370, partial [Proteobacteria bacterium]|nr:hypothetical protein [Pseudomonadota bacterium]
ESDRELSQEVELEFELESDRELSQEVELEFELESDRELSQKLELEFELSQHDVEFDDVLFSWVTLACLACHESFCCLEWNSSKMRLRSSASLEDRADSGDRVAYSNGGLSV